MKSPCDFQKVGTGSQVAKFLILFWTRNLSQKSLKWNRFDFDMLLIKKYYIKKTYFMFVKQNHVGELFIQTSS